MILIKTLKVFEVFLCTLFTLIIFDMFILGGKIKIFILALGNTSSYSPFSTDGQSNWILLLVIGLTVIATYIVYLLLRILYGTDKEKEDDNNEQKEK